MRKQKSEIIENKINDLALTWKRTKVKEVIGKSKTEVFETTKFYKKSNKTIKTIITNMKWSEDFLDEDTGEVVNVERTTEVSIEKITTYSDGTTNTNLRIFDNQYRFNNEIIFKLKN